ncbi:MAG TPA: hypothetical protein VOA41_08955 [Candidatus Dormibacteraeota bacterium]|nr:hypothetical protein [Candidatus Dormibacteraeota bacterium]
MVQNPNPQDAREVIAVILQSWPLYRRFRYDGSLLLNTDERGLYTANSYFLLPEEIVLLCPKCSKEQRWSGINSKVYPTGSLNTTIYRCKNCGQSRISYFFSWTEAKSGGGEFFKAGQYPALSFDPPANLKLETEDRDFYKKALTSRNFSFGVGAVSYLRRVVHNRMDALLDLVVETARASGVPAEKLADVAKVRESRRFEDKVEFASSILPGHLKPDGHNPFDVLHDFTSEGLHSKTEDECLVVFDKVKFVFEYLFRHLTIGTEDAKLYVKNLTALASKNATKK